MVLFQQEKHIKKHDSKEKWADIMIGMDFIRVGGEVGMNCKDCPMFDLHHFDLYGEPMCAEGDFTIRLKRGQGRPNNCPFILDENTLEKAGIYEMPFDLVPFLEGR